MLSGADLSVDFSVDPLEVSGTAADHYDRRPVFVGSRVAALGFTWMGFGSTLWSLPFDAPNAPGAARRDVSDLGVRGLRRCGAAQVPGFLMVEGTRATRESGTAADHYDRRPVIAGSRAAAILGFAWMRLSVALRELADRCPEYAGGSRRAVPDLGVWWAR